MIYASKDDLDYLLRLCQSPGVGPIHERNRLMRCARTVARVLERQADDTAEIPIPVEVQR